MTVKKSAVIGRRLRRVLGGGLATAFGATWWGAVPPARAAVVVVAAPAPRMEPARAPAPVARPGWTAAGSALAIAAASTPGSPGPEPAKRVHHQRRRRPVDTPPTVAPVAEPPVAEPPVAEPPVAEPVAEPAVAEPVAEPVADEPLRFPPIITRSS